LDIFSGVYQVFNVKIKDGCGRLIRKTYFDLGDLEPQDFFTGITETLAGLLVYVNFRTVEIMDLKGVRGKSRSGNLPLK